MITFLAAAILSPFFFEATPEIRTSYVSLGKLMEDRPMQITFARLGYDAGAFGRFGIRNGDVSSLTGRRSDAHSHAFYHTELGPTWQYDLNLADGWTLKSDVTRSWTMYRRFNSAHAASNRTYHWWQIDQSLANPYIVPFYRLRKCFRGNDYVYFMAGVRRRFTLRDCTMAGNGRPSGDLLDPFYFTPSVFVYGGSSRNYRRTFGPRPDGEPWSSGVSAITFRLETGWSFNENFSAFLFVEQYDVVGQGARHVNDASTYRCAHNDWTLGGIGCRLRF